MKRTEFIEQKLEDESVYAIDANDLRLIQEDAIGSVLSVRCGKHFSVPQLNKTEYSGGECGACVRDEYLATLKGLYELIESGVLVRDTSRDSEPGWAMKQLPLVKAIAAAQAAIKKGTHDPHP